uniref:Uncharacterized protein n=1 Tax=Sphaerodactylus townsendi TaxID=933632 RepID=A0ACB8F0M1_9SAUR
MGLYEGQAPELRSFPHFMLALWRQFEDPLEEEKAQVRLRQIRQGPQSVSDGAVKAGTTPDPGKKSPLKKGAGLRVVSRKASLTSEVGGPESSEESAGNDSDLA